MPANSSFILACGNLLNYFAWGEERRNEGLISDPFVKIPRTPIFSRIRIKISHLPKSTLNPSSGGFLYFASSLAEIEASRLFIFRASYTWRYNFVNRREIEYMDSNPYLSYSCLSPSTFFNHATCAAPLFSLSSVRPPLFTPAKWVSVVATRPPFTCTCTNPRIQLRPSPIPSNPRNFYPQRSETRRENVDKKETVIKHGKRKRREATYARRAVRFNKVMGKRRRGLEKLVVLRDKTVFPFSSAY